MSPQKSGDGSTPPTESRDDSASADRASPDQVEAEKPSGSARGQTAGKGERESQAASARPANYKWVGSQVRRMYDSVLSEPVPKTFTDLLRQAYDSKKTREKS